MSQLTIHKGAPGGRFEKLLKVGEKFDNPKQRMRIVDILAHYLDFY